jgi:hypothetical protein
MLFWKMCVPSRSSLRTFPHVFSYPRDPDDEPYINLAIAAAAQYLVSWDKDLLDLMRDEDFRQRFPGLTILNPVALLKAFSPKQGETGKPTPARCAAWYLARTASAWPPRASATAGKGSRPTGK